MKSVAETVGYWKHDWFQVFEVPIFSMCLSYSIWDCNRYEPMYYKSGIFDVHNITYRFEIIRTLWQRGTCKGITRKAFKSIPDCFFIRTSLLKSSNNLESICNHVNIKCSWLEISRIISVTSTFTLWETYTTSVNPTNLKLIIIPIPLHSTIYSALFSLPLSTAFVV